MGQQRSFHIALILIQTRSSEVAESMELPPVTVDSGHTHHRPPGSLCSLPRHEAQIAILYDAS